MSTTGPYLPANPSSGSVGSTAWANTVVRAILYNQGTPQTGDDERPYAVLHQTVAQPYTTATAAPVLFDSEVIDTNNGHSNTVNTSRWTMPTGKSGWVSATAFGAFATNATGDRGFWFLISNTTRGTNSVVPAAGSHPSAQSIADRFFLNPGDYVELWMSQYSGGNLNTDLTLGGCRLTICQERMQ